jgi:hypothetical protein
MRHLLVSLCIALFACAPARAQTPEVQRLGQTIDSLKARQSALQSRIDSLSERRDSLRSIELRKGSVVGVLIEPTRITNAPSITSNTIDNRASGDTVRITDGVDAGDLAKYGFWEVVAGGKTGYVPRTHVRAEDAWLAFTEGRPEGFEYGGGSSQGGEQRSSGRTFSGNGVRSTQPFSIDGGWTLSWSADGAISITVYKDGTPVAVASGQGSGSSYINEGGRVYLQVTSASEWTVNVNP